MNNLKPWYTLNIDVSNAVRTDVDFKKLFNESEFKDDPIGMWFVQNTDLEKFFTKEWLEYMAGLNLSPGTCLIFYRQPYYIHSDVHVDIHMASGSPTVFALNWVLDPEDDSEMIWYDFPENENKFQTTPAGTPYISWPNKVFADKQPIAKCIGNKMTLVRTGLPHNVIVKKKERLAFSIRFPATDNLKDWESAVNFFKPFIKE